MCVKETELAHIQTEEIHCRCGLNCWHSHQDLSRHQGCSQTKDPCMASQDKEVSQDLYLGATVGV